MQLNKEITRDVYGVKITAGDGDKVVGTVFLYVLYNSVHVEPFGFLEYVIVDENYRGKGIGSQLVQAVIAEAKARGCYKLVATSRYGKEELHEWYKKIGFKDCGVEFRMDL